VGIFTVHVCVIMKNNNNKQKAISTTFANSSKVVSSARPKLAQKSVVSKQGNSASSIRISHCEPMCTVPGNSGFNVVYAERIQPGHFTWLGRIASAFETYRLNRLSFKYVPYCSATTSGSVTLFWDPDSKDAAPVDVTSMMSNRFVSSANTWSEFSLKINDIGTLNPVNRHYTRMWSTEEPYDSKTYDTGKIFVVTNGGTSASSVGMVFVEYDITLYDPQVSIELGGTVTFSTASGGGFLSQINVDSVAGRLPVEFRYPTNSEINDGANPGRYVFSFPRGLGVLMTRYLGADVVSGIGHSGLIGSGLSSSAEEQYWSATDNDATSVNKFQASSSALEGTTWYQPYIQNITTLTSLIISFALTNYSKYEL